MLPPIVLKALREAASTLGADECWPWMHFTNNGYGAVSGIGVHRIVFVHVTGPVPDGYQVDHECHDPSVCRGGPSCPHRRCFNPRHLRAIPRGLNAARGTRGATRRAASAGFTVRRDAEFCQRGHRFDVANTIWESHSGRTQRRCRTCRRAQWREHHRAGQLQITQKEG